MLENILCLVWKSCIYIISIAQKVFVDSLCRMGRGTLTLSIAICSMQLIAEDKNFIHTISLNLKTA